MKNGMLQYGLPVLSMSLFFVFWHNAIDWFAVPAYLLPGPLDVAKTLWIGYAGGRFWPHLGITLYEMVVGYAIGCTAALVLGALVAESRIIDRLVYPFIISLQSMPKAALAPLLIVWFGFGPASKIVMVALICFFPTFVNSVTGLRAANQDLLDLYRACRASRLSIFFNVKLPTAASSIFAGLQISVVLALIGAVVAEFIAAQKGLGYLIQSSTLNFDVATMFAAIISLAFVGIVATTVIRVIQAKVVFWDGGRPRASTQAETA
ncbi:ABC transporter permease [Ferrovibrio sp. MS7]|jgi:NitT/TauT family transport system permease protein|uniref:ABC transporter permease n=1 Tax=Ferrovibrio TaxID=1231242 RepID=UPI0031373764